MREYILAEVDDSFGLYPVGLVDVSTLVESTDPVVSSLRAKIFARLHGDEAGEWLTQPEIHALVERRVQTFPAPPGTALMSITFKEGSYEAYKKWEEERGIDRRPD